MSKKSTKATPIKRLREPSPFALTRTGKLFAKMVQPGPKQVASQSDVARALGVTPPSVCDWASGKSRPAIEYRKALARLWPFLEEDGWLTAEELAIAYGGGRTGTDG